MIVYEIQLRYVIRDKIQPVKKSENKIFLSGKKIFHKKKLSQMLSRISSAQSELSLTNRCLSSLSDIFMLQLK